MRSDGGPPDAPSVLVVCWDLPPVDTAEARRTLALVNAMARLLGSVAVLVADETHDARRHGIDPALRRALDDRVTVLTIAASHPDRIQRIDQWPRERAADPEGWREQWLERTGARASESRYGHTHEPLVAEAERARADRRVDLVVAVLGAEAPRLALDVATELSGRWGSPLVVDLARFDPDRLGSEALGVVAAGWCPDDATLARLREASGALADRTTVVPDRTAWVAPTPPRAWPADRPAHVECRVEDDAWPAFVEVLEGWFEARRVVTGLADATMTVRGRIPPSLDGPRQALLMAADRGVVFEPDVSVEEAPGVYAASDLVVAVSLSDGPAGRTTDHLAAGRPVLWCPLGAPQPDHALAQAAQVVVADDLSPEAISSAFARAVLVDPTTATAPAESPWPAAVHAVLAGPIGGESR